MSTMNTTAHTSATPSAIKKAEVLTASPQAGKPAGSCSGRCAKAAADRIRIRAYEVYRTRSTAGQPGNEVTDWLQAERELNGPEAETTKSAEVVVRPRALGEAILPGTK